VQPAPVPHHRSTACAASTGTVGRIKTDQGKVNRQHYQERIIYFPLHCVAKFFLIARRCIFFHLLYKQMSKIERHKSCPTRVWPENHTQK